MADGITWKYQVILDPYKAEDGYHFNFHKTIYRVWHTCSAVEDMYVSKTALTATPSRLRQCSNHGRH